MNVANVFNYRAAHRNEPRRAYDKNQFAGIFPRTHILFSKFSTRTIDYFLRRVKIELSRSVITACTSEGFLNQMHKSLTLGRRDTGAIPLIAIHY